MIQSSSAPGSKPVHSHPGQADPRGCSFPDILRHLSPTVTAVLVDAAFFLKRSRHIFGPQTPQEAARLMHRLALKHLNDASGGQRVARLYRIFGYDAPPANWKGHKPISRLAIDLTKTPEAAWRRDFHQQLRGLRKVALRLGELPTSRVQWKPHPEVLKDLLNGKRNWTDLTDNDFVLDLRQKGVDMRLGLDIASMAFKRQVNQIVLISGDSDFVPAAKMARREGIDFVLDPMWARIRPQLHEHIDGLRSVCPNPQAKENRPKDGTSSTGGQEGPIASRDGEDEEQVQALVQAAPWTPRTVSPDASRSCRTSRISSTAAWRGREPSPGDQRARPGARVQEMP